MIYNYVFEFCKTLFTTRWFHSLWAGLLEKCNLTFPLQLTKFADNSYLQGNL